MQASKRRTAAETVFTFYVDERSPPGAWSSSDDPALAFICWRQSGAATATAEGRQRYGYSTACFTPSSTTATSGSHGRRAGTTTQFAWRIWDLLGQTTEKRAVQILIRLGPLFLTPTGAREYTTRRQLPTPVEVNQLPQHRRDCIPLPGRRRPGCSTERAISAAFPRPAFQGTRRFSVSGRGRRASAKRVIARGNERWARSLPRCCWAALLLGPPRPCRVTHRVDHNGPAGRERGLPRRQMSKTALAGRPGSTGAALLPAQGLRSGPREFPIQRRRCSPLQDLRG